MALIDNLVSYYKLDETSGTTVYDSHGSNDGTNNGATINVAGKIDKAYDFDGSNDRIEQVAKVNYGDFTLSSWIYADVLNTGYKTLYSMRKVGDEVPLMQFRFNANKLGVEVRSNTGKGYIDSYSTTSLNTGQWYHAVLVYSGTTFTIYIDGNVYHTVSYTGGFYKTLTWNDVNKYWIGAGYGLGTPENFFDGVIDEVGIWSRALSSTEVSELYNSGNGLTYPFTSDTVIDDSISISESLTKSITKNINESISINDDVKLPGQVVSKIIYFNNINITQAKIDVVFDNELNNKLYLSNDDGTTWEEVTNGTIHTFTSTGKKLKYKITADVGTIIERVIVTII